MNLWARATAVTGVCATAIAGIAAFTGNLAIIKDSWNKIFGSGVGPPESGTTAPPAATFAREDLIGRWRGDKSDIDFRDDSTCTGNYIDAFLIKRQILVCYWTFQPVSMSDNIFQVIADGQTTEGISFHYRQSYRIIHKNLLHSLDSDYDVIRIK